MRTVRVRSGRPADTKALIPLLSDSFPDSCRFKGPSFVLKRWLLKLLEIGTVWVGVAEVEERVVGVCILILDEIDGRRELKSSSRYLRLSRWLGLALHPRLWNGGIRKKSAAGGDRGYVGRQEEGSDRPGAGPTERTWLELIAVHPSSRGMGVGRALLESIGSRTIESGKRATYLFVDESNGPAVRLYTVAGFRLQKESGSRQVWAKEQAPGFPDDA